MEPHSALPLWESIVDPGFRHGNWEKEVIRAWRVRQRSLSNSAFCTFHPFLPLPVPVWTFLPECLWQVLKKVWTLRGEAANSQWAQGHAKHFAESQCLVTAYTEGSFLYKKLKENHAIRTPAPSSMAWQTLFLGGESHTDFKSCQKPLLWVIRDKWTSYTRCAMSKLFSLFFMEQVQKQLTNAAWVSIWIAISCVHKADELKLPLGFAGKGPVNSHN